MRIKAVLLVGIAACAAHAATVTGRVMLTGATGKRDASGVVVWLEPEGVAPAAARAEPKPAVLDQRNKTFLPHVLAVEVGTPVDFPNSDPIEHNAFSNGDGQVFDLHLWGAKESKRVVFRRAGICRVFCNIHEQMSAIIAVLPTPHFAVTGADGKFAIEAAPGRYRLKVFHERSVDETLKRLERAVEVASGGLALGELPVSEEGWEPKAHLNKYGKAYPKAAEERGFYPGGRR